MKKNLFILCMLLAAAPAIEAQQNFSFPASDAEWITTRVSGCIGGSSIYNLWREYLGPDTVLQGLTYQMLFLQPECTLVTQGLHCNYSLTPYPGEAFAVGGLRVDSQRVYFQKFDVLQDALNYYENDLLDLPSGVDLLLYDFSLAVGDTLAAPLIGGAAKLYKVSTITLLPSGRKKFKLTHINGFGYTHEVVEGAGNTMGLFGNYSDPSASGYLPMEGCFNHNGETVLVSGNCNFCGSVAVHQALPELSFTLFPNPAADGFSIQANTGNAGYYHLKVYDLLGRILFEKVDFNTETFVSTADWPTQTCILSLTNPKGGHIWVQKFQVMH